LQTAQSKTELPRQSSKLEIASSRVGDSISAARKFVKGSQIADLLDLLRLSCRCDLRCHLQRRSLRPHAHQFVTSLTRLARDRRTKVLARSHHLSYYPFQPHEQRLGQLVKACANCAVSDGHVARPELKARKTWAICRPGALTGREKSLLQQPLINARKRIRRCRLRKDTPAYRTSGGF
jgi:hypothetical protein